MSFCVQKKLKCKFGCILQIQNPDFVDSERFPSWVWTGWGSVLCTFVSQCRIERNSFGARPCRLYQTPATPALFVPVAHAISCSCSATKHKLLVVFPLRHEPILVYALLGVPHIGMLSLPYAWNPWLGQFAGFAGLGWPRTRG